MKRCLYYLVCDSCMCAYANGRALKRSLAEARQAAEGAGWTRVPKRSYAAGGSLGADYCPACSRPVVVTVRTVLDEPTTDEILAEKRGDDV